ncbi:hypothetical protein Hanom_Chr07g00606121 [Helianthus anomalus]
MSLDFLFGSPRLYPSGKSHLTWVERVCRVGRCFFNDQQNQSRTLSEHPSDQTEYSESNPSPPPIPGKTR